MPQNVTNKTRQLENGNKTATKCDKYGHDVGNANDQKQRHRPTGSFFFQGAEPSLPEKNILTAPETNCYTKLQNCFTQLTPNNNYS